MIGLKAGAVGLDFINLIRPLLHPLLRIMAKVQAVDPHP